MRSLQLYWEENEVVNPILAGLFGRYYWPMGGGGGGVAPGKNKF